MSQAFAASYENWMTQHESFLEQLLALSSSFPSSSSLSNGFDNETECNALVAQFLGHYRDFHEEKAQVGNENPLVLLSPPWLSSFEKTLLWFGGFKPSMVFSISQKALRETLSEDQNRSIEMMRGDARREEKEIEKEMARIQESLALPPMLDLIKRQRELVDGEISRLEEAMANFREMVRFVLVSADALRETTATKLLGILSPSQAVRFLAAAAEFTVETRRRGLENDRAAQSGEMEALSPF